MKLKVKELVLAQNTIQALLNVEKKTVKQGYWLNRLVTAIAPELDVYNKSIKDLQAKYAKINKDTGEPEFDKKTSMIVYKDAESEVKMNEEANTIWEQEIDVKFEPIDLSIFDGVEYTGPIAYLDKFLK